MDYIKGISRDQLFMLSECLDVTIGVNNPVRVIDAYVNSLNLKELEFKIPKLKVGAPPYDPQLLLKIYIYGYSEKIRTSRKLEQECNRNQELIWLTEGLAPDFKTIADFRRDNTKGIRNVFKDFINFCHSLGLLALKTVAIDGTKFRAQNSLNSIYHKDRIDKTEERLQKKVDEYLSQLDINDKREINDLQIKENDQVQKVVKKLKDALKYQETLKDVKKKFDEDPDLKVYFATDSDSRYQSDKGKVRAGYNVQTVVDNKNYLIIATDVTNESNDLRQMSPMVKKTVETKEELELEESTTVVLDAGYHSEREIMANLDIEGIEIFTPSPKNSNPYKSQKSQKKKTKKKVPAKGFELKDFKYNEENDSFICPEGNELVRINKKSWILPSGKKINKFRCDDCVNCSKKHLCTRRNRGKRVLTVSVNHQFMKKFVKKMQTDESKSIINERKEIVEHQFGTIKRSMGYTYFLQKGFDKVKAEFSFISFIYDFKRVLNIIGVEELLRKLNEGKNQKSLNSKPA